MSNNILGQYQHESILRIATFMRMFEHHGLDLTAPAAASSTPSFVAKNSYTTLNFSRLFAQGKSLLPIQTVNTPSSPVCFQIQHARDLAQANAALTQLAKTILRDTLFPLQREDLTTAQQLRLTQTKFLGPVTLSQMTNGQVSIEEALLLIPCLAMQKKTNKGVIVIPICDPMTGSFHKKFQANVLDSPEYKLLLLDPSQILQSLPTPAYDPEKDCLHTSQLNTEAQTIAQEVIKTVNAPEFSLSATGKQSLLEELQHAITDHARIRLIIDRLESYFPNEEQEAALGCKAQIHQSTQKAFAQCQQLVANLIAEQDFDESLKIMEARARLSQAAAHSALLKSKFDKHKTEIFNYIKHSSTEYNIPTSTTFDIQWIVQGVTVPETMEVTKTCAIARRVFYPGNTESLRRDLVYFPSKPNEGSLISEWKALCRQQSLSDSQLADYLLQLYEGQPIPNALTPLLPFLMVLLLGKEPAYDIASLPANFILLFSVKLGVHSFEEALRSMPMIPQGAIAAKQFLLHVNEQPLDALARVQYKDKKQIPESTFLPTTASFLGPANTWIQTYDDVATTALRCCQRLFFNNIDPENPHLLRLLSQLQQLIGKDSLEVWDIPLQLRLFTEKKCLIICPGDPETTQFLNQKNAYASEFLKAMGQTVSDENEAAEECARFLTSGIDFHDPSTQTLQQLIEQKDRENWNSWMGSHLKGSGPIQEAMKTTIAHWDPAAVCRTHQIHPFNYSDEAIKILEEAWNAHFQHHMSAFPQNNTINRLKEWSLTNYRLPVSYYDLASAINPNNADDGSDLLGEWAMSHILNRHPLRRLQNNVHLSAAASL